jgi:hypothetical protein
MIERYRKQIQELKERTQEPQEESQETGITFKPGPVVSEPEQKQSSTENYNSFNNLELNRTAEKARTLMPQTVSDWLKPEMITTEPYTQVNAMTSGDSVLSIDGDIVTQDKGDSLHSDIFEQVKKELEDLIKIVGPTDSREAESTSKDSGTNIVLSSEVLSRKESFKFPSESVISGLDDMKGFLSADFFSVYGDKRGLQTDPEAFSMSRFKHHFQEGQEHLKNGRYYAAADSFALASIYKSDEPLCLAGRGHALLAAGEYISSALFLSRAIEADPEYLKTKIDLAATLGGQHILGSRIADVKEWLLRSGSGQLDFLLGYIYYRMGRLGPAQQAIDAAYAKMPQSAAVATVKKAVDDALAGK